MIVLNSSWDNTLWKKREYPDNYISPGSFLASLKKNSNFQPYTYFSLVKLSCRIAQHLATVFLFLAVFVRLKERHLDPLNLVWVSIGSFLLGFTTWAFLSFSKGEHSIQHTYQFKALKSSILIFLALVSLSPVLRTLTAATSSDSIWALSAMLFTLNSLLADYSWSRLEQQGHERLTSVLSMNAAVSASVVLASRLSSDIAVFSLVMFAVQAFVLFPILRHRLEVASTTAWTCLTLLLSVLAVWLIAPFSSIVMWLFFFSLVFVTVLAPGILLWAQRYKNNIRGSWDVATPKVN